MMDDLSYDINRFFFRWNLLEGSLGVDAGSVFDFDLCPRSARSAVDPPFADRLEALGEVDRLRERLAAGEGRFVNRELIELRLHGAEVYLRGLLGERFSFTRCLEGMMGISPAPVPLLAVRTAQEQATVALDRLGFPFTTEGADAYHRAEVLPDLSGFEADLRQQAAAWLERVSRRVGVSLPAGEGEFRLEVEEVDAYWSNWIDGSVERGIRLRANTHPRIRYTRASACSLAAHEIAGHALHVLNLAAGVRAGRVDNVSLNLTVHACEAFHMEGLAQSVLPLVGEGEEVSAAAHVREALSRLHQVLTNNAQLEVEAGRPVDEVVRETLRHSPYLSRRSLHLDLRDRSRNPLFRAYQYVYGPSRSTFLRAAGLSWPRRATFLREMYQALYTPAQIWARLDALLGEEGAS